MRFQKKPTIPDAAMGESQAGMWKGLGCTRMPIVVGPNLGMLLGYA